MTVKKAIQILKDQKFKIEDPKHINDESWVFQTASYIKDFFGEKSTEYSFICQFRFDVLASDWESDEYIRNLFSEKNIQAQKYLDNCIETLNNKGLIRKENFLQRFNDGALWSSISIILPAIWGLGFLIGQYTSDVKNYDLRQENKKLRDSLSVLKISAPTKLKNYNRLDSILSKNIGSKNLK